MGLLWESTSPWSPDYLPKILLEEEWEANEPSDIVKWFFQKPTCSHCQHPMGKKTLILELGTALLFGGEVLFFPLSAVLSFVLLVSCILICCFVTDLEHGILPDQFTITLVWVGLASSLMPIFATPKEGEKDVIDLMEVVPQQVLLCIRVLEVVKEVKARMGVNWQGLYQSGTEQIALAAISPRPLGSAASFGLPAGRTTVKLWPGQCYAIAACCSMTGSLKFTVLAG